MELELEEQDFTEFFDDHDKELSNDELRELEKQRKERRQKRQRKRKWKCHQNPDEKDGRCFCINGGSLDKL